jgi:hypothetical protein
MIKKVAAIVLVMIASLLVCGCTTSNTASPTAAGTAYPAAGTRSALLGAIIAQVDAGNGNRYANDEYTMTWLNDTAIAMHEQASFSGAESETYNATFIQFPTVTAASVYFNSKEPGYTQKAVSDSDAYLYALAAGGNATVIKGVRTVSVDGSTINQLEQFDALIIQSTRVNADLNQA